jgi:radical SAM-linked protein
MAKTEEARFISHLEFVRAMERAVRRARVPISYTEGYHPHPKMSFGSALAVGITSEAEYVDLELRSPVSPANLLSALEQALPPGLSALAAGRVISRASLASRIEYASYRAFVRPELCGAAQEFMEGETAIAPVKTKSGRKRVDLRPLVRSLSCHEGILEFVCRSGGRANLRPQDLIAHLATVSGAGEAGGANPDVVGRVPIHRTGLYYVENGDLVSPMDSECEDLATAAGRRSEELSLDAQRNRCQFGQRGNEGCDS